MRDLAGFREAIAHYRKQVGCTEEELARELYISKGELNKRLHDYHHPQSQRTWRLKSEHVKKIVETLAKWGAITSQKQAIALFTQIGYPALQEEIDWQTSPWNRLHLNASKTEPQPSLSLPVPRRLFQARDLPNSYVSRPQPFNEIKHLLLNRQSGQTTAITTALRGAGGFGKTTLALALCHDAEIQAAFPDGILWVTLGENPNIVDALTKLYMALTDLRSIFVDSEDATNNLAEKLEEKACLIVIDDVWNVAHLRPFLQGGAHCSRLLTTRNLEVAVNANALLVEVDEMTTSESVKLLTALLQSEPLDNKSFRELADRLGHYPLLLEITNAMLRKRMITGDTLGGALAWVNKTLDERGVVGIERYDLDRRKRSIAGTISASLELLSLGEQVNYKELAVFPKNVDIPIYALSMLWAKDIYNTELIVQRFSDLSLLRFDPQNKTLNLHEAIHDYLIYQLNNGVLLHERLLEAWGNRYALPDTYAWRYYAYHVLHAKYREGLRTLLMDFTWLKAKIDAIDVHSVLFDYSMIDDDELGMIHDALELSMPIIISDKNQLGTQLYGRLISSTLSGITHFLEDIARNITHPWLRPLTSALKKPGGSLKVTLTGHDKAVNAVAVTPDGRFAISGSTDKTLKIWDLNRRLEVYTLTGHTDAVTAVAVTSDGQFIISGSRDKTLKIWNVSGGDLVQTLEGHSDVITAVQAIPNQHEVLSASYDETLRLWDLLSGSQLKKLIGHNQEVVDTCVTPDGASILSVSHPQGHPSGAGFKMWSLQTGNDRADYTFRDWGYDAVTITTDKRFIICASRWNHLEVKDTQQGHLQTFVMQGHTKQVTALRAIPNSHLIISASADNSLKIWDLETKDNPNHFREPIVFLGLTLKPNQIFSCSRWGPISFWDLEKPDKLFTWWIEGDLRYISPDMKYAVFIGFEKISIFDLTNAKELCSWNFEEYGLIGAGYNYDFAISPNGAWMVVKEFRSITIFDLHNPQNTRFLYSETGAISDILITGDNKHLIIALVSNVIEVWNIETCKKIRQIHEYTGENFSLCLAPDPNQFITVSQKSVKVWHTMKSRALRILSKGKVNSLCFTPNHLYLVTLSENRILKVYSVEKGEVINTFYSDIMIEEVKAVSESRLVLAISSSPSAIKVWNIQNGTELSILYGNESQIAFIEATPDGKLAVSISRAGILNVWDLENGKMVANFTADSPLTYCAIGLNRTRIICGDMLGEVHFLHLDNL